MVAGEFGQMVVVGMGLREHQVGGSEVDVVGIEVGKNQEVVADRLDWVGSIVVVVGRMTGMKVEDRRVHP